MAIRLLLNHFLPKYLLAFALLISSGLSLSASANDEAASKNADAIDWQSDYQLRESKLASRDLSGWKKPNKAVIWGDQADADFYKKHTNDIAIVAVNSVASAKKAIKGADVFVGYCIPALFDKATSIHWMQSLAVGVENCLKSPAMQKSPWHLSNTKRLSAPGIAEHAIALMFSLVRQLDHYGKQQAQQKWQGALASERDQVWEINGRTLLVVGLGGIGSETAKRAKALGMKVLATRNSSRKGPSYVDYVGLSDELLTLAAKADVVVNSLPLTDKTMRLFDSKFFKAMKPSGYFINVGRGRSVDTHALLAALKNGELAGAGLDVTEPEPLPKDHALWQQPRVIITPHIAYRSEKLSQRERQLALENLLRYSRGDKLLSLVDPNKGY